MTSRGLYCAADMQMERRQAPGSGWNRRRARFVRL